MVSRLNVCGVAALAALSAVATGCGATGDGSAASVLGQLTGSGALTDAAGLRFGRGAGGFGGQWGGSPIDRLTEALGLSEEQQAQAEEIFSAARTDMHAVRDEIEAQIRAVLTAEQAAELDELQASQPQGGPGGFRPQGGFGPYGGFRYGGGAGGWHGEDPVERLTEALGLDETQQAAVQSAFDDGRVQREARRALAEEELRAILTEEQAATFEELQAQRPMGFGPHGFGGPQ